MKTELAVVLVSGGLDSCVCAAMANKKYNLAFIHLNYGQLTEQRELRAFNDIADFYNVQKRLSVDVSFFKQIGGSSLTDDTLAVTAADLHSKEIPTSYVPFRNANILAIATSYAEAIGASRIFIGAVEEDSSGYPDCRADFFTAFNRAIQLGTKPDTNIRIETPIISLNKAEIIKLGRDLKAPLDKTWSCYQGEEKACGVCDSCALRLRGFQQAGFEDPISYAIRPEYK